MRLKILRHCSRSECTVASALSARIDSSFNFHEVLEETRADADELPDKIEELVTDFEGARRRIALLENTLNISRRLQNAEILGLRQRLRESEIARNRAIQGV